MVNRLSKALKFLNPIFIRFYFWQGIIFKKKQKNLKVKCYLLYKKIKNNKKNNPLFFFVLQLLARDIRHERNVILQCIRYITQNKFWDLEQKVNGASVRPQLSITSSDEEPHTNGTVECNTTSGPEAYAPGHTTSPKAERMGPGPLLSPRSSQLLSTAELPEAPLVTLPTVDDDIWETPEAICEER